MENSSDAFYDSPATHAFDVAQQFVGFIESDLRSNSFEFAFKISIAGLVKESNYEKLFNLLTTCMSIHEIVKMAAGVILTSFEQITDEEEKRKYINKAEELFASLEESSEELTTPQNVNTETPL
jgi:hypothetical protein